MGGLCGAGAGLRPAPAPHNPPSPFAHSFPADRPVLYPTGGGPASTRNLRNGYSLILSAITGQSAGIMGALQKAV